MLKLFKKSKYQLVLEFHGVDPESFERVVALETQLEAALESGEVDGNDVGQGIVNIFIITKDPKTCFQEAMHIIGRSGASPDAAGYRDLDEEDYVRLWPANDPTPFELK